MRKSFDDTDTQPDTHKPYDSYKYQFTSQAPNCLLAGQTEANDATDNDISEVDKLANKEKNQ